MKETLSRIWSIIRADFLIRFRRPSTAVIFLLLCLAAYFWIPDPASGKALIQIDGQRALYNSPALAIATGLLCSLLLGLMGFYMVSNTIHRDAETRTGFIIASTTVKSHEYLLGKFLGNAVFLSAVVTGFMLSSMAMQLVRGEAPIQPVSFFIHYLLLAPPMITFVSMMAILFESIRFLSGRFGDLAYFFVWLAILAMQAISTESKQPSTWPEYVDTMSFRYMIEEIKKTSGSDSLSIGASSYDRKKPLYVFEGVKFRSSMVLPRIVSTVYPLAFLPLAWAFFHRFNPVKLKSSHHRSRRNIIAWINGKLRPLTVPLFGLFTRVQSRRGFLSSILAEAAIPLKIYPLAVLCLIVFQVISIFAGIKTLREGILPWLFAGLVMLIADLSTRENTEGTSGLIFSMPQLKSGFVVWKFAAALLLVLGFMLLPIIRLLLSSPSAAFSLLIGSMFVAALATCLGTLSSNPKTFIVMFLMFWYLVVNDHGHSAGFNFAGWYGEAPFSVQASYLAASAIALISAALFHRWQVARR